MKQLENILDFIIYQPSICANEKFVAKISEKVNTGRKEGRRGRKGRRGERRERGRGEKPICACNSNRKIRAVS